MTYRCRNWSPENLSNLHKDTKFMYFGIKIQILGLCGSKIWTFLILKNLALGWKCIKGGKDKFHLWNFTSCVINCFEQLFLRITFHLRESGDGRWMKGITYQLEPRTMSNKFLFLSFLQMHTILTCIISAVCYSSCSTNHKS